MLNCGLKTGQQNFFDQPIDDIVFYFFQLTN